MQFIKIQERRFAPVYCSSQLKVFFLISDTPYWTQHSNTTVSDSLTERRLMDYYNISQAS